MDERDLLAMKRIGKNVAKARIEAEISQEELAHRAGIHRTNASRIERGTNSSMVTLLKVARALNVDLSELTRDVE